MQKAIKKGDPNHDQYWLNGVLRPRDFIDLKKDVDGRTEWLREALPAAHSSPRPSLPTTPEEFNAALDAAARTATTVGSATPDGSDVLRATFKFKRGFGPAKTPVVLGTFPIAQASPLMLPDPIRSQP